MTQETIFLTEHSPGLTPVGGATRHWRELITVKEEWATSPAPDALPNE
jgi:hypothetical protein